MIPYGKHCIDEHDIQAVVEILRCGTLTQGAAVEVFEQAVADYVGAKYAVAVSSGTAALHLAAVVANVGPGKALVTSPVTFVASANAAVYAGGSVVFADIDHATLNMSPNSLGAALDDNPDICAVIPVHFAGLPCDMPAIKALADQRGAAVIEDAAHALGALYPDGRKVGSCVYSDMTIFSFHPVKAIAAGEGGMITTNDEATFRRLLRLRSHGINKLDDPLQLAEQAGTDGVYNPWYYEMQELGFHFRITDIQCGLALSQFKKLDRFIARRRELVQAYDAAFLSMKNCRPAQTEGREQSGHHLYVLRIDFAGIGRTRGCVMRALRERGIGSQVHYIPVPAHPFYRRLNHNPDFYPNAQNYYQQALSIPLFYELSNTEQDRVIQAVKELIG
jgi:perosamine synthetase